MKGERNERRTASRAPVNLAVELSGHFPDDGTTLASDSINLSTEGVYCTVGRFVPPLTRLGLALVLPGAERDRKADAGRMVRCEAVAVRCYPERETAGCEQYEVACYFTRMADDDRLAIADFLASHALAE